MNPVILIDVSNLLHRSHFAFRSLSWEGQPTGATHGFLKAIHALREQISKRLIFVWDYGVPVSLEEEMRYVSSCHAQNSLHPDPVGPSNWRLKILPDYKASRKYTEDTRIAQSQMPDLYRALRWMGYSNIGFPGLEADDVMGVLAAGGRYKPSLLLFSSDRDLYQLLTPDGLVRILQPGKDSNGKWRYFDARRLHKEYGISPEWWPAYLALGGDKSDDIKPIRGMGPKTAKALLEPFMRDELPPKYQPHRDLIQKAYQAALLPRSWADPRIAPYGPFPGLPTSRQFWKDDWQREKGFAQFTVFCADRGLTELFQIRKSFFKGEQE